MINVQIVFSRTDAMVPWYHTQWPLELTEYINLTYESTNKFDAFIDESPDGLTLTISQIFASAEDKLEWDNDAYLANFRIARDAYNEGNNITLISNNIIE